MRRIDQREGFSANDVAIMAEIWRFYQEFLGTGFLGTPYHLLTVGTQDIGVRGFHYHK